MEFLDFSLIDAIDIAVVAILIFLVFKLLRGSAAMNLFIAIVIVFAIRVAALALDMKMLSTLMGSIIDIGAIAIVILFQPEIRHFLERMGRNRSTIGRIFDKLFNKGEDHLVGPVINELCQACENMSKSRTGALIVICRKNSLQGVIDTGDSIDANLKSRLIENIFFKNSPLHDGAMIINDGKITAARCTLPMTEKDIPPQFGMRHKAAVGISERSDAVVIVVSEETGKISIVKDGMLLPVDATSLRNELRADFIKE